MGNAVDGQNNHRSVIVHEFEFPNTAVGRLRALVYRLAGRWAMRYLIQQQNEINMLQNQTGIYLKESLQGVDHDVTETRKQVAELTTLVIQQQKKITELEAKVGRLKPPSD